MGRSLLLEGDDQALHYTETYSGQRTVFSLNGPECCTLTAFLYAN